MHDLINYNSVNVRTPKVLRLLQVNHPAKHEELNHFDYGK